MGKIEIKDNLTKAIKLINSKWWMNTVEMADIQKHVSMALDEVNKLPEQDCEVSADKLLDINIEKQNEINLLKSKVYELQKELVELKKNIL
jgi:hypothetical protein